MREFAGKTAFVTGGAGGIGFALGRAFAQAGMKVMLADIEADALQAAVKSLQEITPDIRGTICDVADAASVERAAQATFDAFGHVHVVCNNAGVAAGGGIDHISLDNWRWVIDVNLMGVLHGIRSFLPHIRAHGEGGHIVNTASMAGMQTRTGVQPLWGEQVRRGQHVGGARHAAQAARHRRERIVPELCAHRHRRERAQSAGALRPVAAARPGKPGGGRGGRDRNADCRRGSIPLPSPRACSPPSGKTNSTFSPILTCGPRWRRDSPPFWPPWIG